MKLRLAALALGAVTGFVFAWARMTDPNTFHRMLALDSPRIYLLMAAAVGVAFVGARLLRGGRALLSTGEPINWRPSPPTRSHIVGSILFGIGWGISDACPGPTAAQLGAGRILALAVAAGVLAGVKLQPRLAQVAEDSRTARAAVPAVQSGVDVLYDSGSGRRPVRRSASHPYSKAGRPDRARPDQFTLERPERLRDAVVEQVGHPVVVTLAEASVKFPPQLGQRDGCRRAPHATDSAKPRSRLVTMPPSLMCSAGVRACCHDGLQNRRKVLLIGSRRADSNRGPLHYESRPRGAASPRQSLQALPTSQNHGLGRTARSQRGRSRVRLVFDDVPALSTGRPRAEYGRAGDLWSEASTSLPSKLRSAISRRRGRRSVCLSPRRPPQALPAPTLRPPAPRGRGGIRPPAGRGGGGGTTTGGRSGRVWGARPGGGGGGPHPPGPPRRTAAVGGGWRGGFSCGCGRGGVGGRGC